MRSWVPGNNCMLEASFLRHRNCSSRQCCKEGGFMVEIQKVTVAEEMDQVYRLTHDQYLKEGYITPQPNGLLRHYPHLDWIPETTVLIAVEEGRVVGTNSLTLDGPAGLHVECDSDFKAITDLHRIAAAAGGTKLASSWRIITHPGARNQLSTILALIGATIEEMCRREIHTTLYTFNPKHEQFYAKMLGLKPVAYGRCEAIDSPPAVLMVSEYQDLYEKWQVISRKRKFSFNLRPLNYPQTVLAAESQAV